MKKIHILLTVFLLFLFLAFSFFNTAQANSTLSENNKLIAQVPIVPTIINGVIQPVVNVVPTILNTLNNVINQNPVSLPTNLPVPTLFPPTNQTGNPNSINTPPGTNGSTTTTNNYTTNGYTLPQANTTGNQGNFPLGAMGTKGILFLNRENTVSGRIVLTKEITDVIFGPDSLSHTGILTFAMPSQRGISIIFNFGAFLKQDTTGLHAALPQAIRMEQISNGDSAAVTLPVNEDISLSSADCGDDVWDGTITALMLLPQSAVNIPGNSVGVPLEIGRSDCMVNLHRQANINFTSQMGLHVGYRLQNQEKFTEITSLCPIINNSECYAYIGKNLVVKTYHFTQFVTFKNNNFFGIFLSFIKENNLAALGLAVILALLLILLIKIFSISRKVGTIAEVDRQKDEYVSIASHELRTPLTAVKGWISMILGGNYGSVKKSMEKPLNEVAESAQRSLNLVNDLLDVSRIESGKTTITLSSFPLDMLVLEILASLEPIAKEKGITLEATHLKTINVHADKDKARQIITNLIANALKCTEAGSVTVSSEETKNSVTIFITDTGEGITKEEQQKLFHKFEQGTTSLVKKTTGTGLGLYISRQLARKMGGDVYLAKSTTGMGSTFALSLLPAREIKQHTI